ncbi:hypothetical protein Pst134EA_028211 [Puccinia striiformis f. sp. tritici]|nr:hypothetical protein Pst134EA_028211 [Puccinia striiformis f. sp. tritici]KAH9448921.1 hypothetical protein Pst134EA_028211 [Puccinia striiformis f. sp. tritici]
MPLHHHLDSQSPDPIAMPPEVTQAFNRMSPFLKDISLITGHLANMMAFPPQESRSTSGQEDPPDESVASMDHHSVVEETPSAASNSTTYREHRSEPKACHPTYSQSSEQSFAFANQKPALIETPSSSSKSVINHESIKPTASLPDSSKPAPFTFGTKKPIVPEIPPAACKFGIKHEELNIESKASHPEYSQSASSASAPNKTTASESTCPEDRIATLDGLKVPSASPAFSAFLTKESQSTFTTKDNKPNEPKPTAPTPKIQSQTPKPDLMVWTVYKDARYMITYQGPDDKSIWLNMEFDDLKTCTIAYELESALVMMLEELKTQAKMLPKSKRDGEAHLVCSDLSDIRHTAAIYYDHTVIINSARSTSEALETVKELKQSAIEFDRRCGYVAKP